MIDIQKRIDRIIRRLPENKIYFLGYIWPADRIEPIRKIEGTRHPTIRECIEHILGISLWFFVDFPPDLKKGIGVKEILARFEEMATKGLSQPTDRVLSFLHIIDRKISTPEPAKKLENHFDTHKKQDLRILVGLVLQIYDDITKDIHIGSLPAGKDNTIPRQAFLGWLDDYMKDNIGENVIDYSVLSFEEQAEYVRKWKSKGPQHKTNAEIMKLLWPEEAGKAKKMAKGDPIFERLRGKIRTREGKR